GPPARAVFLVACGPEGGAHAAAFEFAADAGAVTQLDGPYKAFLPAIVKNCGRLRGGVLRPVPEVLRHGRRLNHLTGVEQVVWVKRMFDPAEGLVNDLAKHLGIPFAAGQAITMFPAEGTAKFQNKVRDCFR